MIYDEENILFKGPQIFAKNTGLIKTRNALIPGHFDLLFCFLILLK